MKTILRRSLGFIRVAPDETPEEAIGYYAGPDGTLRLDASPEKAMELACGSAVSEDERKNSKCFKIYAQQMP